MEKQAPTALRKYEAVVIMHPDASEEEQKTLFKKNRDIIKSFKGEVNHLDTWGKRKLANAIEKITRGVFFHTTFTAEGTCVAELERTMRINDRVLRFTHTKLDDRINLTKFVEEYKQALTETARRENEREAKAQARRAQAASRGGDGERDRDRGPRREGRDGGRGGDFDGFDFEGGGRE